MQQNQLNIAVRDTVFDPSLPRDQAKVHIRKKDGRNHYKVWIYLEGADLPYVESVTYTLHETFQNPVRTVERTPSNPNCTIEIWTWGVFTVNATILNKKGFTYRVNHDLTYDQEFPAERDRYVYEEAAPNTDARPELIGYSS